ncbi:MAG: hypothetical protein V1717_01940 [Candidatus Micrarchaeota archaeon]
MATTNEMQWQAPQNVMAPVQTPPPGQVGIYGTVAEAKRPLLVMGTRYDYMMDHLPEYKKFIRYRVYYILSFIAGLWLLLNQPVLSVVAFFLAAYYYHLTDLQKIRTIENKRTVMIGH